MIQMRQNARTYLGRKMPGLSAKAGVMRPISFIALMGIFVMPSVLLAQPNAPVAVVEDVSASVKGVGFMDYVAAGSRITLAPNDSLALGYIKSCVRETIIGGIVTVGTEQSEVVPVRSCAIR